MHITTLLSHLREQAQTFTASIPLPAFIRRHAYLSVGVVVTVSVITLAVFLLTRPTQPVYLTARARHGELRQTVEAVGTVISEKDLALRFPMTGVIEEVLVREGEEVHVGQKLARLRANDLLADIAAATARANSAAAELRALEEGTRPEDLAVTEASVENKRAALEAARANLASAQAQLRTSQEKLEVLQREADISLAGDVATARSIISQQVTVAQTAIQVVNDVLNDVDVQDALIRNEAAAASLFQKRLRELEDDIATFLREQVTFEEYQQALSNLILARAVVAQASDFVDQVYSTIIRVQPTSRFTVSEREAQKAVLSAEKGNIQEALNTLDSAVENLRDATAGFDTRIAAEEATVISAEGKKDTAFADIRTYETSLRIEEAQLELKKAGSRPADIDAARARLQQAHAELARAQARYRDTILTAPIDGTITKVSLKPGELLSTAFASDAAITMLGSSPYRIEMFVAEVDIPKVALTQTGSIELDAFQGMTFLLRVSEVDPAATYIDGVAKYRVKLDFLEPIVEFKIGMTGDATIVTDTRQNIIAIPSRAVLENEAGEEIVRILLPDGSITERKVTTGMEGEEGDIEIVEGVQEGEEVILLIED